ncbi:hypothetical protein N752_29960 [Desulforamulus aquiferis]|nr:hypothetical protein [Desulforamulus aquiferis]RYD01529.1 hypothetical protein N752_29960 [Desulforamulus aquiferis]
MTLPASFTENAPKANKSTNLNGIYRSNKFIGKNAAMQTFDEKDQRIKQLEKRKPKTARED